MPEPVKVDKSVWPRDKDGRMKVYPHSGRGNNGHGGMCKGWGKPGKLESVKEHEDGENENEK